MKKRNERKKRYLAFILAFCSLFIIHMPVRAEEAASYSYVKLADGSWMRTQDAYLAGNCMLRELGLSQPQDLLVQDQKLYIADTGNFRVVVVDMVTDAVTVMGEEVLNHPTGLDVAEDGSVYVADSGLSAVVHFSPEGEVIKQYSRPTEATFGSKTQYSPAKVAVNKKGMLYVVGNGSFDGMIQLNSQGEFLGYYGYNNNPTTIGDYLTDRFFTEEQKKKLFNKIPYSFQNLTMDEKEIIYTVTMTAEGNAVKKHDISGSNIFRTDMADETNFTDLTIGPDGQVYAVTVTGLIYEYDVDGQLLFSFGGMAASRETAGLFTTVSAMDCDEDGRLYVLDAERGLVHVFAPTELADYVHSAMKAYNEGHYQESREIWQQVRRIAGSCQMVENGLGDCYLQLQDFEAAASYYRLAENRDGYSDAYWQIRNGQLARLLPYLAGAILVLLAIGIVEKRRKRTMKKHLAAFPLAEDLAMVRRALSHPVDTFYSIRYEGRGSIPGATLLYAICFLVFVLNYIGRGFVISSHNPSNTSPIYVTVLYVIPVALFLGCNYLVGEIHESKAKFRDLYIGGAYVAAPFIVFIPVLAVLTHFMTLNEARIVSLATFVVYGWVFVMLVILLKEMHAYLLREVVVNLLITIFLMAVVALAVSMLGMFFDRLAGFVTEVIKEVQLRVF